MELCSILPISHVALHARLPQQLSCSKSPINCVKCYKLTVTDSNGADSCYPISWDGTHSSSSSVEVPSTQFYHTIREACGGAIEEVKDYVLAEDVYLECLTHYDWNVIDSNAQGVEESFLSQYNFVCTNQIIRLHISGSLHADFRVSSIRLGPSDLSPTKIARLTTNTSIIVAPFEISRNAETKRDESDCIDEYLQWSSLYELRVLPMAFRRHDTSYFGPNYDTNGHYISHHHSRGEYDELWDCFSDYERGGESCTGVALDDQCLHINSMYIKIWKEILSKRYPESLFWRNLTCESQFDIGLLSKACVSPQDLSTDDRDGSKPTIPSSCPHTIVNICFDDNIRPYHCSMPLSVMKTLGLRAYAGVRLQLINPRNVPSKLPVSVTFRPVQWTSGSNLKTPVLASTVPVTVKVALADAGGDTVMRAHLSRALIVYVENLLHAHRGEDIHGSKSAALLLVDNSVISLQFPRYATVLNSGDNFENKDSNISHSYQCVSIDFRIGVAMSHAKSASLSDHRIIPNCLRLNEVPLTLRNTLFGLKSKILELVSAAEIVNISRDIWTSWVADPFNLTQELLDNNLNLSAMKEFLPTSNKVLSVLLPCLLPLAVTERLRSNICPEIGCVLYGPSGSGKTSYVQAIAYFVENGPRILARSLHLDCGQLINKPLKMVLDELTNVFQRATKLAPCILILDTIDVICPALSDQHGSAYNQQSSLISLHINQLMSQLSFAALQSHEEAVAIIGAEASEAAQQAVARCVCDAVVVIATASSAETISLQLMAYNSFSRQVTMNSIRRGDRLEVLSRSLRAAGLTWHSHTDSDVALDHLCDMTEGYVARDFAVLAKRVVSLVTMQSPTNALLNQRIVDDGITALQRCKLQSYCPVITAEVLLLAGKDNAVQSAGTTGQNDVSAIGWQQVGGLSAAKAMLRDVLLLPVLYRRLYCNSPIRMPKGVLLFGPPGCGKTMFAQATAKECGFTFISVRGPELLDKYIGASEKAVRNLFAKARATGRPTLIFFDEFEALAPKRGKDNTGVTDRVVNQLLTFLDGVEATMGPAGDDDDAGSVGGEVYVLAATSRPDMIDAALLRPGRIEKHVFLDLPGEQEKEEILTTLLATMACSPDIAACINCICRDSHAKYFTPADFKAVVNTAFLLSVHEALDSASNSSKSPGPCATTQNSTITILPSHLEMAFRDTRPSLSLESLARYMDSYKQFIRGSSDAESLSSSPDESFPVASSSHTDIQHQRTALM